MRSASSICTLLLCACVGVSAVERAWKTGTWAPRTEARAYVIETNTELITAEAPGSGDQAALNATPGDSVQYAIEGRTLYVLDADKVEHALTLVGSTAKYSSNYSATGSGHYIRAVAPGGTSVTLEDGSRWDVDPRQHFAVAGWQPDDLITVRRSTSDPAFAYEIDNTSQDDGALANHRVR